MTTTSDPGEPTARTRRPGDESGVRDVIRTAIGRRRGRAGHFLNSSDATRFISTMLAIPVDVTTILDAGCGLGVLTDALNVAGYEAVGIDLDGSAMEEMFSPHRVGSIADLPFSPLAFDAVVVNEVLEHLPFHVFDASRKQIARVARRYVIVTVPNAESLESASTMCPMCRAVYSIHGHVRRFDRSDMESLIPQFRLRTLTTTGPFKIRHRTVEWLMRRRLLGRWPKQPGAVCPQCAYRQPGSPESTELLGDRRSSLLRAVLGAPWERWWLVGLYERA